MGTPTSGGGRHRRRIRIVPPIAAAGLAAAVAGALLTSSAEATEAPRTPTITAPSVKEMQKRLDIALAGDDIPGQTASKDSLSASTSATTIDPKIIGGTDTAITSAPWMAQLWYGDDRGTDTTSDDIGFFCGGAVVSPTKILTAAHCVKGYNWYANGYIITGTSQLPSGSDLHGGTRTFALRQWNEQCSRPVDRPSGRDAKGVPSRMIL